LSLEQKYLKHPSATVRRLRRAENPQCPAYEPPYFIGADNMPGLVVGIRSRADFDYARFLISTALSDGDEMWWHANGWCTVPAVDLYVSYLHTSAQLVLEMAISPRHRISSSP
jgi:ER degradation enhancer, mannosidase alpha-like 1